MVAVIERLDRDFRRFAPSWWRRPAFPVPALSGTRASRPTRRPSRRNIAAQFPPRRAVEERVARSLPRGEPRAVLVAGGLYAPRVPSCTPSASTSPATSGASGRSSRPHGSVAPADSRATASSASPWVRRRPPGADYLRYKQFLVWAEFPPALATTPRFYPTVVGLFETAHPSSASCASRSQRARHASPAWTSSRLPTMDFNDVRRRCTERFLDYVTFDTRSEETSDTYPSTPGQLVLARHSSTS